MTLKQINKELSNLACGFPTLCFGGPVNNSMFHWQATSLPVFFLSWPSRAPTELNAQQEPH
uniref:UBC core domain-containing protein n=1 Tax=Ursus americanus TaxID=9643 RepID=A0A452R3K9_URSAM